MAKAARRSDAKQFLKQSDEFLTEAKVALENCRYNVAVFTGVQAMINANDALTIHHLEKRASSDHKEALTLHTEFVKKTGDSSQKDRFRDALQIRSNAGYMGESLLKADAEKIVRLSSNFVEWVKKKTM
jgi:HEPN domain-containing protein